MQTIIPILTVAPLWSSFFNYQGVALALPQYSSLLRGNTTTTTTTTTDNNNNNYKPRGKFRIAFVGTSLTYFNNLPYIVGQVFLAAGYDFEEKNVLRAADNLATVWDNACNVAGVLTYVCPYLMYYGPANMMDMLEDVDDDEGWDYVVLQDSTRVPDDPDQKQLVQNYLQTNYAPYLAGLGITPIFYQVYPYHPNYDPQGGALQSEFEEQYHRIIDTYQSYHVTMNTAFSQLGSPQPQPQDDSNGTTTTNVLKARIAPIADAFRETLYTDKALFDRLYYPDYVHPKPCGALLIAYLLFMTVTYGEDPLAEAYSLEWWDNNHRYMTNQLLNQPKDTDFPTMEEARMLRDIARIVYARAKEEGTL